MPRVFEGHLIATDLRFAILTGRWNHFISDRLLEGALDAIHRHGGDPDAIDIYHVPGAFEVPIALRRIALRKEHDAIICLGTLIRGSTPHFDYISSEVTKGIAQVGMDTGIPCAYGILTCDTIDQAIERAGTKAGNKGHEAAMAAIEMANLFRQIDS